MTRKIVTSLIGLSLAACCGADEIWCLNRTTDTVKRFDSRTGGFLGYVVSTNAQHNPLINPGLAGADLISIQRDAERRIYLLNNKPLANTVEGHVSRYDRDGGNAVVPLANDPRGDWYKKYYYPMEALTLHGTNLYIGGKPWSTTAGITTTLRGSRLVFEHNLSDGSAAGRRVGALPGTDDYKTGAMWIHATNTATVVPGTISGMAFNSLGHLIVGAHIGHVFGGVYRFNGDGEWLGPAGVGDASSFVPTAIKDIFGMLIDSSDRIYLCGEGGGATASGIERYHADGSPAPGQGQAGAYFHGWDGYVETTPVYPEAMALNTAETVLYVYCRGLTTALGVIDPAIRMYAVGGENDGAYLGTLILGTTAEADIILYVETPPSGTAVMVR